LKVPASPSLTEGEAVMDINERKFFVKERSEVLDGEQIRELVENSKTNALKKLDDLEEGDSTTIKVDEGDNPIPSEYEVVRVSELVDGSMEVPIPVEIAVKTASSKRMCPGCGLPVKEFDWSTGFDQADPQEVVAKGTCPKCNHEVENVYVFSGTRDSDTKEMFYRL